jgi:hypothetical protein
VTALGEDTIEVVRTRTLLGIALHDLVTDARITDGLSVDARPLTGGRVTPAFQTRSGAYGFRGLDGMTGLELPGTEAPHPDRPAGTAEFLVAVVDARARFLPTVLRVPVPSSGLITQADVLPFDSPPNGAQRPWGSSEPVSPADLPVYLFSAPSRVLPGHVAAVRANVVSVSDGRPAAFCRLDLVVETSASVRRRYVGVADAEGTVVVPFAYPRFGSAQDGAASPPEGGTPGVPPAARTWSIEVRVRHRPDVLEHHAGLPAPTLSSILAQQEAALLPEAGRPPLLSLTTELEYGRELILRTAGDAESRLLIESP